MKHLIIRQSGGANIVSIPKAILKMLNLNTGSLLDLSLVDGKIVLTPLIEKPTFSLSELLADSPPHQLHLLAEDDEWLSEPPAHKEVG
jgi:antitoxin ChpS